MIKNPENRIRALRYVLLVIGAAFIMYGLYRGEAGSVLAKAVKLCMECVGIG